MRAFIIAVDGKIVETQDVKPADGLQPYYAAINTNIVQPITFRWGEMWLDEEGKFKSGPGRGFNQVATDIWTAQYGPSDVMVGVAVLRVKGNRKLPWETLGESYKVDFTPLPSD